ncbi:hypothetical protein HZS_8094, partial [Henneguya salminicola]
MEAVGFSFDNCRRNERLISNEKFKSNLPIPKKTGTTIAGVLFKEGVIIGADTRSTMGTIVAEKNCLKVHYLTDNIFACGAGTSADLLKVTDMVSQNLKLIELNTGRKVRVVTAVTIVKQYLFRYQGHIGAYLIIGGVDLSGPNLYSVSNRGHTDRLPFVTNGSGCLASMSFFESNYREDFDLETAKEFVARGIAAGVMNDLGSGSNVDLCVITKHGMEMLRNYWKLYGKTPLLRNYDFPKGTTNVLKHN